MIKLTIKSFFPYLFLSDVDGNLLLSMTEVYLEKHLYFSSQNGYPGMVIWKKLIYESCTSSHFSHRWRQKQRSKNTKNYKVRYFLFYLLIDLFIYDRFLILIVLSVVHWLVHLPYQGRKPPSTNPAHFEFKFTFVLSC